MTTAQHRGVWCTCGWFGDDPADLHRHYDTECLLDVDMSSPASCRYFIATGRYLLHDEVAVLRDHRWCRYCSAANYPAAPGVPSYRCPHAPVDAPVWHLDRRWLYLPGLSRRHVA